VAPSPYVEEFYEPEPVEVTVETPFITVNIPFTVFVFLLGIGIFGFGVSRLFMYTMDAIIARRDKWGNWGKWRK
jgi:hypothetical protein